MNMKGNKLLVLSASVLVLAGCNSGSSSSDYTYSYNTYLSTSPSTWNNHTWETSDEGYISGFTEMGLYDVELNADKNGYNFVAEMASDMPISRTQDDLSDEELDTYYSDIGNITANMVWDIPLNTSACWEDGTPITAQDYVDSMELQLSSEYANYRADSYYSSSFVLVNAENFYKQGRQTVEPVYSYINQTTGEVEDDSGYYYLNLGKGNKAYTGTVFRDADDDTNFYMVLNQLGSTYGVKEEADRIINAYSYYLWKSVDHASSTHASSWSTVTEPGDVSSSMIEDDNVDMDLDIFDDGFTDTSGNRLYIMRKINNSGEWVEGNLEEYTTSDVQNDLRTVVRAIGGTSGMTGQRWAWKLPLFTLVYTYDGETIEMSQVGIRKINDYTIRLYFAKSISGLDLKFSLSSNWLVKTDLYKNLTTTLPTGLKATSYATASADNYMSYGPYRLENFTPGEQIHIVKNDAWYGWTDGKHEGQFQMEELNTRIYAQHSTAMNEFLAGRLDDMDLTVDEVSTYGTSRRAKTTYESYTQKISFNSDYDKLEDRQGTNTGINKTILSNIDFRRGLSLGLNRREFAAQATSGSTPFTGLLNDLYLANNATGETYRSTEQGQSVYGMVYDTLGGSTIGEETPLAENVYGYNRPLAVEYLEKAMRDELAITATGKSGHLKAGDTITIEFRVYDDEATNTVHAVDFMREYWTQLIADAVTGLRESNDLASSETINFSLQVTKDQDYYNTAITGDYDMIFSIWGGAAINPCGLMDVYCSIEQTNCCEYGFKGKQNTVMLDIDADGDGDIADDETKSFDAWNTYMQEDDSCDDASLVDGDGNPLEGYVDEWETAHNRKFNILAGLEAGIINRFEAVPLVARGTTSLLGYKVEYGTDTYVSLIGYGGIRSMTFNYTNDGWTEFCNQNNNSLSDVYKL